MLVCAIDCVVLWIFASVPQSTRDDHRRIGADILDQALRYRTRGLAKARSAGQQVKETLRVGISGPPGVGKSTFIEALGVALIRDHGLRVAVIAIDPTSHKSSGAILGDKTRMTDLSMMAEAFVRPCAAGFKHLGGLSLHSDELVLLCMSEDGLVSYMRMRWGQSRRIVPSYIVCMRCA